MSTHVSLRSHVDLLGSQVGHEFTWVSPTVDKPKTAQASGVSSNSQAKDDQDALEQLYDYYSEILM